MTAEDSDPRPANDRWADVDRAFREALRRPAAGREAWARSQFAGDPELLAELLELLAADEASADLFESAERALSESAAGDEGAPEAGRLVGQRIGPYRLEALLATGGMGAVYRAARDDGQFRQTVAIKILPGWATDEKTVARLRAERQILARLQHPGITRLLDGGETPDGYPYIVAEYIDGEPLDRWLGSRRPDLETRLNLFIRVAEAVQHAHEQGIVHRDLKPSNVMVDRQGRPHLLDFGIAKLLETGGGDWTAPRTATGFTPMTPEFASPEQRAGGTVGEASDVYQLGLLLFQLLTGLAPRRHVRGAAGPTRPSTVLTQHGAPESLPDDVPAAQLARQLKGELDTIVLEALREEPAARYASAASLAEDLRRYLRGEPIEARPETLWSATRRLARHYPVAAGLAAALVCVLALSATGLYLYAREVEAQRDLATRQAARAEATRDTLLDLFRRADPLQQDTVGGRTATVFDSLDAAVADARRQLADQPELLAELLSTLSGLYHNAGRTERAMDLAQEAIGIYRGLGPGFEGPLATNLSEYAGFLDDTDAAGAGVLMEEALSFVPALRGSQPDAAVAVLMDAGYGDYDAGLSETALEHFEEADGIFHEAGLDDPSQEIEILFSRANALAGLGRHEDARPLLDQALALGEAEFGREHQRLAGILSSLSNLERRYGDPEAAVTHGERLVAVLEANNAVSYHSLLSARNNLALAYGATGRSRDEQRLLREVIDMRREEAGPDGSQALALSLKNLASSLQGSGDHLAALEALEESERLLDRHLPAGSPYHALPHFTRGLVFLDMGRPGAAEPEFRVTLAVLEPVLDEGHFQVQTTRCMLAEAYRAQGREPEARDLATPALAGMQASGPADHPYLARCVRTVELIGS